MGFLGSSPEGSGEIVRVPLVVRYTNDFRSLDTVSFVLRCVVDDKAL